MGLVAFDPDAVHERERRRHAEEEGRQLGVTKVSDLKGKSQNLTLYGSPECRQRPDCLVGLEQDYGLKFKKFVPVDIGLRYEVLDKGQADLSIIFTTDAQLSTRKDVVTLEDDKKVFPPGNVTFVARKTTVDEAGPDMQKTIETGAAGPDREGHAGAERARRRRPRDAARGRAGVPEGVRLHQVAEREFDQSEPPACMASEKKAAGVVEWQS